MFTVDNKVQGVTFDQEPSCCFFLRGAGCGFLNISYRTKIAVMRNIFNQFILNWETSDRCKV